MTIIPSAIRQNWSSQVDRSSKYENNLLRAELQESTRDATDALELFSRAPLFLALHHDTKESQFESIEFSFK